MENIGFMVEVVGYGVGGGELGLAVVVDSFRILDVVWVLTFLVLIVFC